MLARFQTRHITRKINHFLRDNNFTCKARLGEDFAYLYNKAIITYPVVMQDRGGELFMQFAQSQGLDVDCGSFILSLFHEIGHDETIDEIDDEEYAYCQDVKAELGNTDNDYFTYFALEDELQATLWAIDYINHHPKKVERLARSLEHEFKRFYRHNKIKD